MVQQFYGKEVQLNTDASSQVTGTIDLGESIEAMVRNVNNEKLVLFIQQLKKPNRVYWQPKMFPAL